MCFKKLIKKDIKAFTYSLFPFVSNEGKRLILKLELLFTFLYLRHALFDVTPKLPSAELLKQDCSCSESYFHLMLGFHACESISSNYACLCKFYHFW